MKTAIQVKVLCYSALKTASVQVVYQGECHVLVGAHQQRLVQEGLVMKQCVAAWSR